MDEQRKIEDAKKFDKGKLRYDLLPPYPLEKLVEVYTFGSSKYGDHNWLKGMSWSRFFGAMMRHAWAFWSGEEIDKESGIPHLAHAAWCCFALLQYSQSNRGSDDRVKKDL